MTSPRIFLTSLLTTTCLTAAENMVDERWDWLVANSIAGDSEQPFEYRAGFTDAVRLAVDMALEAKDLHWSPLAHASQERQKGYKDGIQAAEIVIEMEIESALGLERGEIEYLGFGRYRRRMK